MKTERRHALARNELADLIGEKIEALKPYSTAITATALAVVVAIFAFVLWSRKSESRRAKAWEEYFAASQSADNSDAKLLEVIDDYPRSSAALWARISLADKQLAKGVDQLFNDRTLARQSLDEAVEEFRTALDEAADDPLLAERAMFGLAEAYEAKNDLSQAREQYRALLDQWPQGAFAGIANDRLADLERRGTKEFYDWFAKHSPQPKAPKGPGVPGQRPPFDTGSLSDDIFSPGIDLHGSGAGGKSKAGKNKKEADPIGSLLDDDHVRPDGSKSSRKSDDADDADATDADATDANSTGGDEAAGAQPATDADPDTEHEPRGEPSDTSAAPPADPASSLGGKPE
jgi:tetratricopeptide (TPR) repeat protein